MANIYTGRGDEGQTDLFNGERISKTHPRIKAYGEVDELNSLLGVAGSFIEHDDDLKNILLEIQNDLHIICANLANPKEGTDRPEVSSESIDRLENNIDSLNDETPELTSFILPGGTKAGSHLHHARTVCRRAERRVVDIKETSDQTIQTINITYLNRLSDLLFVLARAVNHRHNHTEQTPDY